MLPRGKRKKEERPPTRTRGGEGCVARGKKRQYVLKRKKCRARSAGARPGDRSTSIRGGGKNV